MSQPSPRSNSHSRPTSRFLLGLDGFKQQIGKIGKTLVHTIASKYEPRAAVADDLLVSCKQQLVQLKMELSRFEKQFESYHKQMQSMCHSSLELAQTVDSFYINYKAQRPSTPSLSSSKPPPPTAPKHPAPPPRDSKASPRPKPPPPGSSASNGSSGSSPNRPKSNTPNASDASNAPKTANTPNTPNTSHPNSVTRTSHVSNHSGASVSNHLSRVNLAPSEYHRHVSNISQACKEAFGTHTPNSTHSGHSGHSQASGRLAVSQMVREWLNEIEAVQLQITHADSLHKDLSHQGQRLQALTDAYIRRHEQYVAHFGQLGPDTPSSRNASKSPQRSKNTLNSQNSGNSSGGLSLGDFGSIGSLGSNSSSPHSHASVPTKEELRNLKQKIKECQSGYDRANLVFTASKSDIRAKVENIMYDRLIRFDPLYVELLACQMNFFQRAGAVTQSYGSVVQGFKSLPASKKSEARKNAKKNNKTSKSGHHTLNAANVANAANATNRDSEGSYGNVVSPGKTGGQSHQSLRRYGRSGRSKAGARGKTPPKHAPPMKPTGRPPQTPSLQSISETPSDIGGNTHEIRIPEPLDLNPSNASSMSSNSELREIQEIKDIREQRRRADANERINKLIESGSNEIEIERELNQITMGLNANSRRGRNAVHGEERRAPSESADSRHLDILGLVADNSHDSARSAAAAEESVSSNVRHSHGLHGHAASGRDDEEESIHANILDMIDTPPAQGNNYSSYANNPNAGGNEKNVLNSGHNGNVVSQDGNDGENGSNDSNELNVMNGMSGMNANGGNENWGASFMEDFGELREPSLSNSDLLHHMSERRLSTDSFFVKILNGGNPSQSGNQNDRDDPPPPITPMNDDDNDLLGSKFNSRYGSFAPDGSKFNFSGSGTSGANDGNHRSRASRNTTPRNAEKGKNKNKNGLDGIGVDLDLNGMNRGPGGRRSTGAARNGSGASRNESGGRGRPQRTSAPSAPSAPSTRVGSSLDSFNLSLKQQHAALKVAEKRFEEIQQRFKKEDEERQQRQDAFDAHGSRIDRWEFDDKHSRRNLRTLLIKLPSVLWPESGWQQVSLGGLVSEDMVKKHYRKAVRLVHPDRSKHRGDSVERRAICERIFEGLNTAWDAEFGKK